MEDFADDKCDSKMNFLLGSVENIVGKGENAGYKISAFPDEKIRGIQMTKFVSTRVENIGGKGDKSVQNTSFCQSTGGSINPFPNNETLDQSKMKALSDNKMSTIQ